MSKVSVDFKEKKNIFMLHLLIFEIVNAFSS